MLLLSVPAWSQFALDALWERSHILTGLTSNFLDMKIIADRICLVHQPVISEFLAAAPPMFIKISFGPSKFVVPAFFFFGGSPWNLFQLTHQHNVCGKKVLTPPSHFWTSIPLPQLMPTQAASLDLISMILNIVYHFSPNRFIYTQKEPPLLKKKKNFIVVITSFDFCACYFYLLQNILAIHQTSD